MEPALALTLAAHWTADSGVVQAPVASERQEGELHRSAGLLERLSAYAQSRK